jgi:hypothetical protein
MDRRAVFSESLDRCIVCSVRHPGGFIALSLMVALLAPVDSCGGSSANQGGVRQNCYPNGTCNAGLACLSNVCVSPGTGGADGGAAGVGGGGTGGGTAGVGGTSGGGAGTGGSGASGGGQTGTGGACAYCAGMTPHCPSDVATAFMCSSPGDTCCGSNGEQWTCGACAAETCHWVRSCAGAGGGGGASGADSGGSDASGADGGLTDGLSGDVSGQGLLGASCVNSSDCVSALCEPFRQNSVKLCTQPCSTNAPCPTPATSGTCGGKGYCTIN